MATDNEARAGILYVKVNGIQMDAKGTFTYNLGGVKRDPIIGVDRVHGYSTKVQVPKIEGKITDSGSLSVDSILNIKKATATLELENGKTIVLKDAWYAGEGDIDTEEGEIELLLNGLSATEIL